VIVGPERVRADQLGQLVGLVGLRAFHAAHFVQNDGHAGIRRLPRCFRSGHAAADDMNGFDAHGRDMRRPARSVKTGFAAAPGGGKAFCMDSNASSPAVSPSIPDLIVQAWRLAAQAALPSLPWLALLALDGRFLQMGAQHRRRRHNADAGGARRSFPVGGAGLADDLPGDDSGSERGLHGPDAHEPRHLYLAFFFIGFFIFFFVGVFGVVMLQLSGLVDFAAEGADEQIPAALAGMMSTPYGWALSAVYATGLGGLAFLALRLLLAGAATVQTGRVMVFRTWRWTKGDVLRLGAASLATHVLPFLAGYVANLLIVGTAGQGEIAIFATGVSGLFLQAPFILAGHGLAVAALRAAHPPASVA
jgi:hypothetical protein